MQYVSLSTKPFAPYKPRGLAHFADILPSTFSLRLMEGSSNFPYFSNVPTLFPTHSPLLMGKFAKLIHIFSLRFVFFLSNSIQNKWLVGNQIITNNQRCIGSRYHRLSAVGTSTENQKRLLAPVPIVGSLYRFWHISNKSRICFSDFQLLVFSLNLFVFPISLFLSNAAQPHLLDLLLQIWY